MIAAHTPSRSAILVDDDPSYVWLVEITLERLGLKDSVVVVQDPTKVEEYLITFKAKHESLPSVVLLDMNMPGVYGVDLLRTLRANDELAMIPIVMMSSTFDADERAEAYAAGANSCVPKPAHLDDYPKTFDLIARYWLYLEQGIARGH